MESLSIFDLNIDCIFHILFFLPLMESLKFAYACDDFYDVILTFLRFKTVTISECRKYIGIEDIEPILLKFGPFVKQLNLDEPIDNVNIQIYKYIADNCYDIDTIELHYPSRVEYDNYISLVYRILSTAKQIKSVKIERKIFTDDWPNPWYYRVLEEKICEMISNLECLNKLHINHFYKASGKFLNNLRNLTDLNIEYCISLKSEHFINLCQTIKLKRLNIDNCRFLNNESLEALVDTQTALEHLTLNTEFDAKNFELIGKMKNLKELIVFDYYGGRSLDKLVENIAEYHCDDFKVLKIFTNARTIVENHRMFLQRLLLLRNLKVLCLPYECLDETYILAIGTMMFKLEKLRFDIEENSASGKDELSRRAEISRLQRKLSPSNPDFLFTVDLLQPIIEARRDKNCRQLILYLDVDYIAESVYKSKEYIENFDVLRIEAVC